MRKTIAAVTVGLLLVAGQAAASNNAVARVGDRVGARADASSEFQFGGAGAGGMGLGMALGAAALALSFYVASEEADEPNFRTPSRR